MMTQERTFRRVDLDLIEARFLIQKAAGKTVGDQKSFRLSTSSVTGPSFTNSTSMWA